MTRMNAPNPNSILSGSHQIWDLGGVRGPCTRQQPNANCIYALSEWQIMLDMATAEQTHENIHPRFKL